MEVKHPSCMFFEGTEKTGFLFWKKTKTYWYIASEMPTQYMKIRIEADKIDRATATMLATAISKELPEGFTEAEFKEAAKSTLQSSVKGKDLNKDARIITEKKPASGWGSWLWVPFGILGGGFRGR